MTWQLELEVPATTPNELLDPRDVWQHAFVAEWCRLAEGRADPEQTADLAIELYRSHWARDPAEVAQEFWDAPTF
ncbi:MAG: hypothetical protein EOP82_24820 [Variovorax sp.]|nr:MAG: hypothetical protein EOP82_24820 [Variovorax sp.]